MKQQEIELKLAAMANPLALYDHPSIVRYSKEPPKTIDLHTTYYDTSAYDLLNTGVALRIRESDEGLVQTIKTVGKENLGMQLRTEWHKPIGAQEIDLSIVDDPGLQKALMTIATDKEIVPLFTTQFSRTIWDLAPTDKIHIEVVLDQGEICADNTCIPIQEIELELCQGKPVFLFEVAADLALQMPIAVDPYSKAWKGYQLHQAVHAGRRYQAPAIDAAQSPEWFLHQAAQLRQQGE